QQKELVFIVILIIRNAMNLAHNLIDNNTIELKPEYHFNEVKKQYQELATIYSLLSKITPHVLSLLQHDLTRDISAPETSQFRELDERLRLILEIGDPDMLVDLKVNNDFK
ncbi:14043_t:CDS:2, partial [Racocetra fulgida]